MNVRTAQKAFVLMFIGLVMVIGVLVGRFASMPIPDVVIMFASILAGISGIFGFVEIFLA